MRGDQINIESTHRMKRREAILNIVKSGRIKSHNDIVAELEERGVDTVQGTVSRDLDVLKIKKGDSGFYEITPETQRDMHLTDIQNILQTSPVTYYKNVATHYVKVEKGKASLLAFHLQEVFPTVILDVTIRMDSLVLLINLDAETEDFFDLMANS
ncbi:arginine repressor [Metaplanococcus flavidus]|uniref:Arginine repressor DNA-binding domain-containing protein n=1 Tax=Metaplanococcus flavidus TaxID=569883 RepID=A0ABW3LDN5_9BACL